MRSFQIQDNKGFMKQLLLEETFDSFLLYEASLTTYATFQIDGAFHSEYFQSEEDGQPGAENSGYTLWKRLRPFFFDLTRGKHTPLKFRIIFRLAPHNVERLLKQSGVAIPSDQIEGLYLNIHFDGKEIRCVSGTSLRLFTLDKALEHAWDDMLEKFFRQQQIPVL